MDALETILTRRSIRTYTTQKVSDEIIEKLIEASVSAPSAGNQQPWHFIVIDNREILDKIPDFHPNAKMLKKAQRAILVCGDLNLEKYKGYWILDCSSATQNILLAAHALGLGSCWLGVYPREDRIKHLKELFKLPENIVPFSIISLGYTNEKQDKVKRETKSRTHENKW
jgi:nitroreductase